MTQRDLREELEALFTRHRINELRLDPVQGTFDAAHLREINRRIFQDLPAAGFPEVRPGKYREPVADGGLDWIKRRQLESIGASTTVAYSRMDDAALARLDAILERADPTELAKLDTEAFTKAIGQLYAELDYIHPFPDGNSRTLRSFTEQLASEAGYDLDWSRFAVSEAGRDILYIARDLSVNEIALPEVSGDNTMRALVYMMDRFSRNRDLADLLRDAISPSVSAAQEKTAEQGDPVDLIPGSAARDEAQVPAADLDRLQELARQTWDRIEGAPPGAVRAQLAAELAEYLGDLPDALRSDDLRRIEGAARSASRSDDHDLDL